MAEVVKHVFPKLVDVHNYSAANATPQKMQNWFLLNRKVFKHLEFELSEDIIRQLSNAQIGVIERLLYMLRTRMERMQYEKQMKAELRAFENDRTEVDQNTLRKVSPRRDVKKAAAPRSIIGAKGAGFKGKNPQDEMVPLLMLEEKEQEVLAKTETIQILQAKIKRLEHLLHLKDIRIEDLQSRLESTRATGKR